MTTTSSNMTILTSEKSTVTTPMINSTTATAMTTTPMATPMATLVFRLDDVEVEGTDDALDDVARRNVGVGHLEFVAQQLAAEVPPLTSRLLKRVENHDAEMLGVITGRYQSPKKSDLVPSILLGLV